LAGARAAQQAAGIYVTKLDDERADFMNALADIKEKFKVDPVPFTLPMEQEPPTRA
jgi:elongation factor G